jgi:hypothetical protein
LAHLERVHRFREQKIVGSGRGQEKFREICKIGLPGLGVDRSVPAWIHSHHWFSVVWAEIRGFLRDWLVAGKLFRIS